MNSFLAREIVIWLILSCIVVVIPLIIVFKKILPVFFPVINVLYTSTTSLVSKLSHKIASQKELRRIKKEKKTARDEAIRVAQQAEAKSNEKTLEEHIIIADTTSVSNTNKDEKINDGLLEEPDESDQETQEKNIKSETPVKETKPSYEEPIRKGSNRSLTHSSDIDQQKFQKQLESIKYAALTYKERGKLERYEKKLIEGLSLQQDNQEFMNMLADHYFSTGNNVKALTLLKKIVTVQTQNHKAIWQIGRIYQAQEKTEAAQLLIEKALEQKPDHPKYLISLVEVHYEKGDKRASLEIMESLRKIRPTNIDYLLTVATLHEELNEPTFARNYYMKILELDPHNEHAKDGLKGL